MRRTQTRTGVLGRSTAFARALVAAAALALLLSGCMVPSTSGQAPAGWVGPPTINVSGIPYGPLPVQLLDIHYPTTNRSGPFPVVVYAHTGGWIGGDRGTIPDVIQVLANDTGVALVSIDYRLASQNPDGTWNNAFPAAQQDMDRAIRFVRAHAAQYDFDPNMIIAAGVSAGGQLAALAGAAPGTYADPTLTPQEQAVSPAVQGVIDYVGPSDFTTFYQAGGFAPGIETDLLGCKTAGDPSTCDPALMTAASVVPHLAAGAPPAYLAYGAQDTLVVPATQGTPLALAWARARGDLAQPVGFLRGVWYELEANSNHTFTVANSNFKTLELWVQWVVEHVLK